MTDADPTVRGPAKAKDNASAAFWRGVVAAGMVLVALDWLLGALLWLPFFSGLLGFLVEGLIAGGIGFRIARAARPVPRWKLWLGIALLVAVSSTALLWFEHHHFSAQVGRAPMFAEARTAAIRNASTDKARREAVREVGAESEAAFRAFLDRSYPPGGPLGYARWATGSGTATLQVRGVEDEVKAGHRGWAWPIRTGLGALLLLLGLALAFDGLKSPTPVRNVLSPGEEYEEIE